MNSALKELIIIKVILVYDKGLECASIYFD